jgi:hypothetical protein
VSSVEADQLRVTEEQLRPVAVRPVGAVGGWVSAAAAGDTPASTVDRARRTRGRNISGPSQYG